MDVSDFLRGSVPAAVHSAGVDLVDLRRWELAVARTRGQLLRRVFDASEREAAERAADGTWTPERILGHAFGVKEGVVKALGGLPPGARLCDIRVAIAADRPEPSGRQVQLHGEPARWAARHRVELTAGTRDLGDDMAMAWVVAHPAATTETAR
ncbi:4'-phosphopantetheinyl transferase superfamily protein [Streptomyces sp. CT34]|uniref:4'-phosphopantetheinyl transferase superfamily protein n=1 Tax=Streptomyces sp. CT34 TaxID=1553907 RepID=UPI0005BC36CD|nr:4'-phosphopantetheinyl transferase superfamily protein [Streptomyces sp. CT34]